MLGVCLLFLAQYVVSCPSVSLDASKSMPASFYFQDNVTFGSPLALHFRSHADADACRVLLTTSFDLGLVDPQSQFCICWCIDSGTNRGVCFDMSAFKACRKRNITISIAKKDASMLQLVWMTVSSL